MLDIMIVLIYIIYMMIHNQPISPDQEGGRGKENGMKIKVNDKIVVEPRINQTSVTPSGNAYYNIDYLVDGICVHNATTGCIGGAPNPIAMLDRTYSYSEYHYQDIPNPDPQPESLPISDGKLCGGSSGGRPCWWVEKEKTHRQAIIDAVSQIVPD